MAAVAEYEASLRQINEGLKLDPTNAEMLQLKHEVLELIAALKGPSTSASVPTSSAPSSSSASTTQAPAAPPASPPGAEPSSPPAASAGHTTHFGVGSEVFAQWSQDSVWYEAVVDDLRGPDAFLVTFTGYGNQEERSREFMRPRTGSHTLHSLNAAISRKRAAEAAEAALPPKVKAKKNEAQARKDKKEKELREEKASSSWKTFANKGAIAATTAPVRKHESIFKSPDAPGGKVGVTGSGKGMTSFTETRIKWDGLKKAPGTGDTS
jgi:survival-of-motor-neuron-related-splicing factor 30